MQRTQHVVVNTTESAITIPGLGVIEAGQTRIVTSADASWFRIVRGVPLTQENMPDGIVVTEEDV